MYLHHFLQSLIGSGANELAVDGLVLVLARLLNALAQALQSAGVNLSQASVSVQIDLGKRRNRGMTSGTCTPKV